MPKITDKCMFIHLENQISPDCNGLLAVNDSVDLADALLDRLSKPFK